MKSVNHRKSIDRIKKLGREIRSSSFSRRYLVFASILLGISTVFWSIIGSLIQQDNADQIVNVSLLHDLHTFQGAIFPDQHTFLLKIPFFILVQLLGGTAFAFSFVTTIICLLTVGSLAYILYRIEKRPLVLGTILLALAACLMLIPAQPYAGGLLPVNMAMLTTRNLEYIIFIISLVLLINSKRYKSKSFILSCLLMILLIASDKLFVSLSAGGAIIGIILYAIARKKELVRLSLKWLVVSAIGYAGASGLLLLLNATRLIHTSGSTVAGPYGLVRSIKDLLTGLFYGLTGVFTNFGANPVVDVNVIKEVPSQLVSRFIQPGIGTFIITGIIAIGIVVIMFVLVRKSTIKKVTHSVKKTQDYMLLSLMLILTSVAGFGVFVVSNHYYPVDARYVTVILFAGFISLTSFMRGKKVPAQYLTIAGGVLTICIIISVPVVASELHSSKQALTETNQRNTLVVGYLKSHPVDTLVGDYWRVIPIQFLSGNSINVTPMSSCTTARPILTSTTWQPNLTNHSFAYLLRLDQSTVDYPACSLGDIITAYGKPNQSTIIKGTVKQPKELLLFYDHGINHSSVIQAKKIPSSSRLLDTVVPKLLSEVKNTQCSGPASMNFVAHEDDDILFMNPDIMHDIQAGSCIRTVYFTAGDAGNDAVYWTGRQKGAEAAYDAMLGKSDQVWIERIVQLPEGQIATIANPKGNSQISLIFLHLPDGNVQGASFSRYHNQSLAKLYSGSIGTINTVDGNSSYTSTQLVDAIISLIKTYLPTQLRSQSSYTGVKYKDHSDHTNVAHYVSRAYSTYTDQQQSAGQVSAPLIFYIGYPVHAMAPNISGHDYDKKVTTFFEYGKFDNSTCHTINECNSRSTYGDYLNKQYTYPN